MSQQALTKIAFPAKEPTQNDLRRVLELATRMMDRKPSASGTRKSRVPDNVIAFPGSR